MSENILFGRFEVDSEINADDVFRYVVARDKQKGNQRLLVAQLQAPWRENSDVVEDLNEYFGCLQRVRTQSVMRVLAVNQNREDGFGVAFEEPEGICLEELSDLGATMQATVFVDNLCEAIHKANVKGVFHCHLRKQDIWVSGNTLGITGFGYSVLAKHGWKGSVINMPPELASGEEIDSRSDVYSIGQLLAEQYPDHQGDLLRALEHDPEQRYRKARDFLGEVSEKCKGWKSRKRAGNKVNVKEKVSVNPVLVDSNPDSSEQPDRDDRPKEVGRSEMSDDKSIDDYVRQCTTECSQQSYVDCAQFELIYRKVSEKFFDASPDRLRAKIHLSIKKLRLFDESKAVPLLQRNIEVYSKNGHKISRLSVKKVINSAVEQGMNKSTAEKIASDHIYRKGMKISLI